MEKRGCLGCIRRPFREKRTVPTLLHLAKRGKFDSMINLLTGEFHQFYLDECADSANHHGTLNMFLGKSTLQLVMACRPPVELVDLLIRRCQEHNPDHSPEDSIDMQGRTPLHVAVEHGCSLATCKRLMGDNLPVIMKDQMDRTPLHYACMYAKSDSTTKLSSRHQQSTKRHQHNAAIADEMERVICALINAYPEATGIEDLNGKTPLMLAIEHRADNRVTAMLMNVRDRIEQPNYYKGDKLKELLGSSMFTITSSSFSEDDLSSVGSCGVSAIEI